MTTSPSLVHKPLGRYRWTICALVFFATTVNYLDRQVISLLKDDYLEPLFKWSESDYANIGIVFQISYAIGILGAGWFVDKIGTKIGYAVSLALWSFSAIAHAFTRSTLGFMVARSALGVSESGNFPSAIKTIAEWFPKKERALATGIFNSGSNIGAIIAPLTVPLIAMKFGWGWAFILTGGVGLIWLVFWFLFYEVPTRHKKLSKEELAYIQSDVEDSAPEETGEKVKWTKLLSYRQTWAFISGKFLTDPVWWFFIFWLPSFLNKQYGMTKTDLALPIAVVYCITTVGSIFGGWLSGSLMKRGLTTYTARKIAMFVFAVCVIPVISAQALGKINPWFAILIIGLASACHQAWSANIFTTTSDMFPKKTIGSVTGLGGMAGSLGGILIFKFAGALFDHYIALHNIETGYYIMFFICGSMYLIAWLLFYVVLVPRMKPVEL